MPICPRCNSQVSVQANTCHICASPLWANYSDDDEDESIESIQEDEKVCPSCNITNNAKWIFCYSCGTSMASVPINVPIKAPTLAEQNLNNNAFEDRSFAPASDLFDEPEESEESEDKPPAPTKSVGESLEELIFCAICGQANPKDTQNCLSCDNALVRTLTMGSQISHPKLILMKDSGETEIYGITENEFIIGRSQGDATFPQDNYMSGRHARIVYKDKRYFLVDEQSKNGVYKRLKEELILKNGHIILVGRQVFRFEQ